MTPDLSQQAAEVCARLAANGWSADIFLDRDSSPLVATAFRYTIELCLKHLDALPDELREHIRPLSDDERLERAADAWAKDRFGIDPFRATAAKAGFIAGAGHKAAQS